MLDIEEFKKKLDKKSRLMGIDPGRKRVVLFNTPVCFKNYRQDKKKNYIKANK